VTCVPCVWSSYGTGAVTRDGITLWGNDFAVGSGLGIRCAERTFAYPPYSQPTSSPAVASRATLSVLRACAMTVTARADPDRYLRKYIIGALGLPTKHCHWKPYFLITHTDFSALA